MEKKEIRRKVKAAVLAVPRKERDRRSQEIQQRVLGLAEFRDARCVASYLALPFEVTTDALMRESLTAGKMLVLPRVVWNEGRMDMVRVTHMDTDLILGPKGIMEPTGEEIVPPADIDLVVVPGRAFDKACSRIGQGGGFYDAYLAKLRADCVTCAAAFDVQVLDSVPACGHDVPVDMVVTETYMYRRYV